MAGYPTGRPRTKWNLDNSRALQLGNRTGYAPRLLAPLLPVLREVVDDAEGKRLVEQLAAWKGDYPVDSTAATLFNQLLFQIAEGALHDELGDAFFDSLIATRAIDSALPRLAGDADSPWWDDRRTERRETRADIVRTAWNASLAHLRGTLGNDPSGWLWGKAHTLTHEHALGQQALLKRLLNVGPFAAPGTHEVPNNLSAKIGPAPGRSPTVHRPGAWWTSPTRPTASASTRSGRAACPSTATTTTRPRPTSRATTCRSTTRKTR